MSEIVDMDTFARCPELTPQGRIVSVEMLLISCAGRDDARLFGPIYEEVYRQIGRKAFHRDRDRQVAAVQRTFEAFGVELVNKMDVPVFQRVERAVALLEAALKVANELAGRRIQ